MTRVLLTADTVGGVWSYAADLCAALPRFGIEPVLATLGPRPAPHQRAEIDAQLIETDLPLDWLADSPAEVRRAGDGIADLAARIGADLVQLNAPALAAETRFDRPVLAVAHSCVCTWWHAVRSGPIDPELGWRAALTAAGLRTATRALAPSAAFAQALATCYGLETFPAVVHNGRRAPEAPRGHPHDFAFTAGRLWDEGKNAATLDRAAALMRVPLRAAGPRVAPHGAEVALQHAEALGALPGTGVAAQLALQPVFVSAAVYEPFGLSVLEAAQAGCPLVLSDIPTFRELWDGAARFVYPHDAAGFARAVDEIIADPALRARLSDAATARARGYTVDAMAAAMAGHYDALAIPPLLEAAE
jgi:glycosyltransferase involved in cell wall biosynthesis